MREFKLFTKTRWYTYKEICNISQIYGFKKMGKKLCDNIKNGKASGGWGMNIINKLQSLS